MSQTIKSPVTGFVVAVMKRRGDACMTGEALLILESMKMQFNVDAPCDGLVDDVMFDEGDTVEEGQALARVTQS